MSTVLLDNSTYFSFKRLLDGQQVDADTLYNASTFLECLITADKIRTSPTLAWTPGASDRLFVPGGPCRSMSHTQFDDARLSLIFRKAIHDSINDLSVGALRKFINADTATVGQARCLMQAWKADVERSPREFLKIYSGAVYLTDPASKATVSRLDTEVAAEDSPARHLSQFLLRTNAAIEFASSDAATIPYHPHSYRAPFVINKLHVAARKSHAFAVAFLHDFEDEFTEIKDALTQSPLAWFGAFTSLGDDAPLVLAVTLSGSRSPEEVLCRALEIRDGREARQYRKWVRKILAAIRSRDSKKQIEAHNELGLARQVLADELKRLYGINRADIVSSTAKIATAIDIETLATSDSPKLAYKALTEVIKGFPATRNWIERRLLKRKVALLIQLAKRGSPEKRLNDLLKRTFRIQLSDTDISRLKELRNAQLSSVRTIFKRWHRGG